MRPIETLVTNLPWQEHHKARLVEAAPEAKIIYVDPRDPAALHARSGCRGHSGPPRCI